MPPSCSSRDCPASVGHATLHISPFCVCAELILKDDLFSLLLLAKLLKSSHLNDKRDKVHKEDTIITKVIFLETI